MLPTSSLSLALPFFSTTAAALLSGASALASAGAEPNSNEDGNEKNRTDNRVRSTYHFDARNNTRAVGSTGRPAEVMRYSSVQGGVMLYAMHD